MKIQKLVGLALGTTSTAALLLAAGCGGDSNVDFTPISSGPTPAVLSVDAGASYSFSLVALNSSATHTLTISNQAGGADATNFSPTIDAPFSYLGGSFPGIGGTCSSTVAAGSSCTIVIAYSATANGVSSGNLTLSYFDSANNQTLAFGLTAVGTDDAVLAISDGPTYNYGANTIGYPVSKTFTVTNTGGFPASGISVTGLSAPFGRTGGTCTDTLANSSSCTLIVAFTPSSLSAANGTITLNYNNGATSSSTSRTMTGTGINPAQLVISDGATYDFLTQVVGSTTIKQFTVTNNGGQTATTLAAGTPSLAAPFSYVGGSYPGTSGTCGTSLPNTPGSNTCTINVQYAPTGSGLSTGSIALSYVDGGGTTSTSRAIQGTGTNAAQLSIAPTGFDFGTHATNTTTTQTFTIINNGFYKATSMADGGALSSVYTYAGGTYPGTGGTCGSTLGPNASCTITVNFVPTLQQAYPSTLKLNYFDGANNQNVATAIQGTGTTSAFLTLSDGPTFDFGTQSNSTSPNHIFTLTNTGGVSATSITLTAPGGAFSTGTFPNGGTCSTGTFSLAAGASCTFAVTFTPPASGTVSSSVSFTYAGGGANTNVSRAIQGTGTTNAFISISDTPTYVYPVAAVGATVAHSFTITNSGGTSATSLSASVSGTPFAFNGGTYPGTGGNCGATLAAGANCTINVVFSPTTVNTFSKTVTVNYNNGVSAQSASVAVNATSVTPASLALSDGPSFDYGQFALGNSVDHSFTLSNSGGYAATGVSAVAPTGKFSFKGGSFPGTGGTCSVSLAAADSCTIVVTYAPSISAGTDVSAFGVSYADGTGSGSPSVSRAIQGESAAPAVLAFAPTGVSLGTVAIGASIDSTYTVTNTGGVSATAITSNGQATPFTYKGGTFPGTGGTCASGLSAGSSCTIVATYAPGSGGLTSRSVTLTYANGVTGGQSASASFSATAATPASLATAPSGAPGATGVSFGTVARGASIDTIFIVSNSGGVAATGISASALAAPYSYKGGSFPGTGGTCSSSLAGGASCTYVVTYAPTVNGASSSTPTLTYANGLTAGLTSAVSLQGTAADPANISPNPASIVFGSIASGGSVDVTVTLTNSGGVLANFQNTPAPSGLTSVLGFKAPSGVSSVSGPGVGGTCANGIAPGTSCTAVFSFAPPSNGSYSTTGQFFYFNGIGLTSFTAPLSGTGVAPALLVAAPTGFDFGTKATGSTTNTTTTITNNGSVAATGITFTAMSSNFAFAGTGGYPGTGGTCGISLAAGASCTVVNTFSPNSNGATSNDPTVNYNNGAAGTSMTFHQQGTGAPPAQLTINGGTTYDFGTLVTTASTGATLTVNNTGGVPAQSMAGVAPTGAFSFAGGTYPGTGGTCGTTLGVSASCTIVVNFSTVSVGLKTSQVGLTYNNGAAGPINAGLNIQGTGAAPASLAFNDGSSFNYGSISNSNSMDHHFYITNNGGVSATGLAAAAFTTGNFAMKGGSYPGVGGTCGPSLAAGASCGIVVTWTASGANSDTLKVNYNTGLAASSASIAISGTGTANASLAITEFPANYYSQYGVPTDAPTGTFGTAALNATVEKTIWVTNNGASDATSISANALSAPFSYKGGSYPGVGGSCGATLPVGQNCSIVLLFTPTSAVSSNATVTLTYNNGATSGNTAARSFSGTGTTAASLAIYDFTNTNFDGTVTGLLFAPTWDFGTIGINTLAEHDFFVYNAGGATATGISAGTGSGPFTWQSGSFPGNSGFSNEFSNGVPYCGSTLSPGQGCAIAVVYDPTVVANNSGSIAVNYNNGTATRALHGASVSTALLQVSSPYNDGPGNSFDFGTIGSTGPTTATAGLLITNVGAATGTSISGAAMGTYFAYAGSGTYPGGAGNLTINQHGGTVSYPFCGSTIGIGATCAIAVNFQPGVVGTNVSTFYSNVGLNYTNGVTGASTSFAIQGEATSSAIVAIQMLNNNNHNNSGSGTPTMNFGYMPNSQSTTNMVLLQNSGATTTNLSDAGAMANGFAYAGTGGYPGGTGTYTMNFQSYNYCGSSLAPGANCVLQIQYTASASGSVPQISTLKINTSNAVTPNVVMDLSGTPTNQAIAMISNCDNCTSGGGGTPTQNWGTVAASGAYTQIFKIQNAGGGTATLADGGTLTAPYNWTNGSFPGSSAPTGNFCGGGTNCGNTYNYCGSTLAAGQSCIISVTYAPSSTPASTSSVLTINLGTSAANATSLVYNLMGTSTNNPIMTISDFGNGGNNCGGNGCSPFSFGTAGTGVVHTFLVQNTGNNAATSLADGLTLGPNFSWPTGNFPGSNAPTGSMNGQTYFFCGSNLNANSSCLMTVQFNGSNTTSTFSSTITLDYVGGTVTRSIQGTGTNRALISISDSGLGSCDQLTCNSSYNIGGISATTSKDITLTLRNQGGAAVTSNLVGGASFSTSGGANGGFTSGTWSLGFKGGTGPGTGGTCGSSLPVGGSCTIVLTVGAPPSSGNQFNGYMSLNYSDSSGTVLPVSQGSGMANTDQRYISGAD